MKLIRKIWNFLINGIEYPYWCYGLECEICQCTFKSPRFHFEHCVENKTLSKHINKIPILKK